MQEDLYTAFVTSNKAGILTWPEDVKCKKRLADILRHPRVINTDEKPFIERVTGVFRRYTKREGDLINTIHARKVRK